MIVYTYLPNYKCDIQRIVNTINKLYIYHNYISVNFKVLLFQFLWLIYTVDASYKTDIGKNRTVSLISYYLNESYRQSEKKT